MTKQYVYAVVESSASTPKDVAGFEGARLSLLRYNALGAIVCAVPAAVSVCREHVLHHEALVEAVRANGPGLPVRFGTILPDAPSVANVLSSRYQVLLADLRRLGDKLEFGVAALWTPPDLSDSGGDCRLKLDGPGARFMAERLASHGREVRLRARAEALTRRLESALREHSLEAHCSILPTNRLLFRASYLLAPSDIGGFRQALAFIRAAHPELAIQASGPWPPYSFVSPPPKRGEKMQNRVDPTSEQPILDV